MKSATKETYLERILKVLVHIQGHLDQAMDLDALARIAHFSPYHFHRIFRGMVGESVAAHVRRLRLERAAHRLKFSDQPVTNIAFEAGYETHESFTRAFGAMFEQSPSSFREANQAIDVPSSPSRVHFDPKGDVGEFKPHEEGGNTMEVTTKTLEPKRVAFVRHVGPYSQVGDTWGKLMSWAGPRGMLGPAMTMIGLCHDDPDVTPPDKLRYDACLPVEPNAEAEGEIGIQTIEGGDYAVVMHEGPYENMGETYAKLCGQWLPNSGRELSSAPCFQVYKNDPSTTAPQDLRTEIYMRLE